MLLASVAPLDALKCYQCSQRLENVQTCLTSTQQDCAVAGITNAVCMQSITTFNTGQPSFVEAQCVNRELFADVFLNRCVSGEVGTANANNIVSDAASSAG